MKCPQCSNEMVKAQATNFGEPYDYCRVCKKEASETKSDITMTAAEALRMLYEPMPTRKLRDPLKEMCGDHPPIFALFDKESK